MNKSLVLQTLINFSGFRKISGKFLPKKFQFQNFPKNPQLFAIIPGMTDCKGRNSREKKKNKHETLKNKVD